MPPNQSFGKYWMFTINNPRESHIEDSPDVWPGVQWVIWQKERGDNGTVHLQGYVQFLSQKRLSTLKRLSRRAHWERRRGTHAQAKAYCPKEETRMAGPFEKGEEQLTYQGKRKDILDLKRALDAGKSEYEIAQDDELYGYWVRHYKTVERYKMLCVESRRTWQTVTSVYWGEPGVGKSRRALDEGGADAYWLPKPTGSSVWWNGYCGQEVVVIDEFYGWISRDMMCRLCDRYPLYVETKGGAVQFSLSSGGLGGEADGAFS